MINIEVGQEVNCLVCESRGYMVQLYAADSTMAIRYIHFLCVACKGTGRVKIEEWQPNV